MDETVIISTSPSISKEIIVEVTPEAKTESPIKFPQVAKPPIGNIVRPRGPPRPVLI